jgi:hypothetical protein
VSSASSEENEGVPPVMEKVFDNIKVFISNLSAINLVEKLEEKEDIVDFSKTLSLVEALRCLIHLGNLFVTQLNSISCNSRNISWVTISIN